MGFGLMVEWQKLAIKTIGDDVAGSFISNAAIATFQDDFTSYTTQAEADAHWTITGPTDIRVNIATDVIDWDFVRLAGNRSCSFDLYEFGKFSNITPGTGNWALRFKVTFGSNLTAPTSITNTGHIGLFELERRPSADNQDFIAYEFSFDSGGTRQIALVTGNGVPPDTPDTTDAFTKTFNSDEVLYFELKRTADANIEGTIYSDADYSVIIEKLKVTGINTAITQMRFIEVKNDEGSLSDGTFEGTTDDVEFFNESEGLQDFFTVKGNDKALTYDIFPDLITGDVTPDFVADFTSTTGWVTNDGARGIVKPDANLMFYRSECDQGLNQLYNQIIGGLISDSAWVIRGDVNLTHSDNGTTVDKTIFIGMWSSIVGATSNQDGIYLTFATNSSINADDEMFAYIAHVNNQQPNSKAHDTDFTYDFADPLRAGRYFYELKRTSTTTVEATIFSEKGFTDPLQTITATIPAGVVSLQYFKIMNRIDVDFTGFIESTYQELEFWDGVTEVCTFNTTPVLEQDTAQAVLNYCRSSIFYTGIEDNTNNAISVDLGTTLSDSAFVLRCQIDVVDNNVTASNNPFHWLGLFDLPSSTGGSTTQSGIALRADPTTGNYAPSHGADAIPATAWTNETAYTDLTITNGIFYLEIARTSSTQVTMSLFNDELFNDLISSRTFTISASVNDLRYLSIKNRIDTASTAFWEIIVTNIQIWDIVDNVDGFTGFRSLELQSKAVQLNGVIDMGFIFNSHDETVNYSKGTSFNGIADVITNNQRFVDIEGTPSASDHQSVMVVYNQLGTNKTTHGYDCVQANTFGPANVPDRTESYALIKNMTEEQINKIQIRNSEAGDYDTDSEIVVFGTD